MTLRVVGLGQRAAGDDGVGHAVLDALAALELPPTVELSWAEEASALVALLEGAESVIVVDAVIGAGAPGEVRVFCGEELSTEAMSSVSSHGLGVSQAIALARALDDDITEDVRFVAVTIDPPRRREIGLSEAVLRAVPEAARRVLDMLREKGTK